jgi:hypothetical protein
LGWDSVELPYILLVSMPLGKSVEVGKYIPSCMVRVGKKDLSGDLIMIPFEDYDLILGMEWLLEHYKEKLIQFVRPGKGVLEFNGSRVKELRYLISGAKT